MTDTARQLEDTGGRLVKDPHHPLLEEELRRLKWRLVGERCAGAFYDVGRAMAHLIASVSQRSPPLMRKPR